MTGGRARLWRCRLLRQRHHPRGRHQRQPVHQSAPCRRRMRLPGKAAASSRRNRRRGRCRRTDGGRSPARRHTGHRMRSCLMSPVSGCGPGQRKGQPKPLPLSLQQHPEGRQRRRRWPGAGLVAHAVGEPPRDRHQRWSCRLATWWRSRGEPDLPHLPAPPRSSRMRCHRLPTRRRRRWRWLAAAPAAVVAAWPQPPPSQ